MDMPIVAATEDDVMTAINTTPLVDVMLVLLIVFLIAIPVVLPTVAVDLPKERNRPTQSHPTDIVLAVDRDGTVFWNEQPVGGLSALVERLKEDSVRSPQPEVHIRADRNARYAEVGKVVLACQRAGIAKVGFVTEPMSDGR